ncbi:MAG: GspE/PulE family protein [Verrucomicrobiota bacterium]|jgi:type IV pilus assembly protein PilB|nr:GspE/PulE family protein [Verrucomicrobiota bacterium]HCF95819.1 pilus assembly protein PilB [Verrucomicrobiota bacterium]
MVEGQTDILAHLLLEEGVISKMQLQEAMEEHKRTGRPLFDILIDFELLTEDRLLELIANYLGTEVVDLTSLDPPKDLIRALPASAARLYQTVPVGENPDGTLVLAALDALNPQVADELRFVLGREVHIVVARPEEILKWVDEYFTDEGESVGDLITQLEQGELGQSLNFDESDSQSLEEVSNAAPIVRFVNLVLYQAVKDRASDIHFEPFEHEFKIRYRVDGALYEMAPPPRHLALPVTSRIKVMSGLNISERRLPQDGRIQVTIDRRRIDLRVSTLPTQFGESVVLRVLDKSVVSLSLDKLGLPDDVNERLRAHIWRPNGIIVVTGPTGSGKTTTLYSCLSLLNKLEDKLLTAEDPVEYDIEGIMQVPINEAVGLTFAASLRSFLRQDPDRIMVGEIRDLQTAQIAIQASLTGHLVLSTLHTNDAAGGVTRLIDMGAEPFLISSTLIAILAQRLVRTICKGCRTSFTPDDDVLRTINLTREQVGGRPFYFGRGCQACNDTGYKGRTGIFEYLPSSEVIQDLINQRSPTGVIRDRAVEEGMRPIREDGIRHIFEGNTTVEEVVKYT